jgi:hypothetical protein
MTELADEDDLQSFAKAFIILARAKPASAASAASYIPGKISNFLIKASRRSSKCNDGIRAHAL